MSQSSRSAQETALLLKAQRYLESFPGRSTLASNVILNNLIRDCKEGKSTDEDLAELSAHLTYREDLGIQADKFCDAMDLRPFPRFQDWGFHEHWWPEHGHFSSDGNHDIWRAIVDARLFPKPPNGVGPAQWPKQWQLLATACVAKGLEPGEVKKRAEQAKRRLANEALVEKEMQERPR